MKKVILSAVASLALIGAASAAETMTDAQMDNTTAGGSISSKGGNLAIALGGSAASAKYGKVNLAGAAHVNYTKTTPNSAYAASAGIAVSYSSGQSRGCRPRCHSGDK